jgi:xanthine dehydrogenase YagS FAD-binding subunit
MTMPASIDDVRARLAGGGEARAGGTDVVARQRGGRATGPFVDLGGVAALRGVTWRPDGSARIGATTTVAEVAADPALRAAYPALTATAGALATPQVRAAGTVGGNLLQRNRCWYFRDARFDCHQTGGDGCPARAGLHPNGVAIDLGPCVAPHPSSLAVALLAYGATVEAHGAGVLAVGDLYGDGADPTRDHLLPPGDVLLAAGLPPPVPDERAAYHRAISRAEAEWPMVEAVARLVVSDGVVAMAAVAAGGVARVPLRLPEVEAELVGREPVGDTLPEAAAKATERCSPTSQTRYKVGLLRDTVLEVLELALVTGG